MLQTLRLWRRKAIKRELLATKGRIKGWKKVDDLAHCQPEELWEWQMAVATFLQVVQQALELYYLCCCPAKVRRQGLRLRGASVSHPDQDAAAAAAAAKASVAAPQMQRQWVPAQVATEPGADGIEVRLPTQGATEDGQREQQQKEEAQKQHLDADEQWEQQAWQDLGLVEQMRQLEEALAATDPAQLDEAVREEMRELLAQLDALAEVFHGQMAAGGTGRAHEEPQQQASAAAAGTSILASTVGFRLLKLAGWREGAGCGAQEQGITEPVRPADQQGRRGLGFAAAELPTKTKTMGKGKAQRRSTRYSQH